MKQYVFCFIFLFLSGYIFSNEKYLENATFLGKYAPTEIETIESLAQNVKKAENSYNAVKFFKVLSVIGVIGGSTSGTVALTMRRLGAIENDPFQKLSIASASVLGGCLITAIITGALEQKYFDDVAYHQDILTDYLESSNYFMGDLQ